MSGPAPQAAPAHAPETVPEPTPEDPAPGGGFATFLVVWCGQTASLLGSNLTGFALGIWIYQRTGSVTDFALISFFTVGPGLLLAPVTGALVDRWDRRRAMMLSDSGAALGTLVVALLLLAGRLELWHIYVAMAVSSLFGAFQWPAYLAATTLLVPSRHLGRAAGLRQVGQSASNLVAPALGGVLLTSVGIEWVLWIDLGTFAFALVTLALVRIPRHRPLDEERGPGLAARIRFGWRYLRQRRALFDLLVFAAVTNFFVQLSQVLAPPMVLEFAGAAELGVAVSVASAGMLAGGVVLSVWGGPERRVVGQMVGMVVCGLCLGASALRPSLLVFTVGAFGYFAAFSISNGCAQALWQDKVDPAVQGRVFAMRRLGAWSTMPLAYLVAGPLSDHLFEPLLASDGALASTFVGDLLGVGPGRGIALLFVLSGLAVSAVTLYYFRRPRVRRVDLDLPGHAEARR